MTSTWVKIEAMVRLDEGDLPPFADTASAVIQAIEDVMLPNGEGEVTRVNVEKIDRPEVQA